MYVYTHIIHVCMYVYIGREKEHEGEEGEFRFVVWLVPSWQSVPSGFWYGRIPRITLLPVLLGSSRRALHGIITATIRNLTAIMPNEPPPEENIGP